MGLAEGDNQKPRLLYCPRCKRDEINDKLDPICFSCKGKLLTVTFSMLTGQRLTGLEFPKIEVK
jgi:hypothetical protein